MGDVNFQKFMIPFWKHRNQGHHLRQVSEEDQSVAIQLPPTDRGRWWVSPIYTDQKCECCWLISTYFWWVQPIRLFQRGQKSKSIMPGGGHAMSFLCNKSWMLNTSVHDKFKCLCIESLVQLAKYGHLHSNSLLQVLLHTWLIHFVPFLKEPCWVVTLFKQ